jgi:hypothetical protein
MLLYVLDSRIVSLIPPIALPIHTALVLFHRAKSLFALPPCFPVFVLLVTVLALSLIPIHVSSPKSPQSPSGYRLYSQDSILSKRPHFLSLSSGSRLFFIFLIMLYYLQRSCQLDTTA